MDNVISEVSILFNDGEVVVVNKPVGISVHNKEDDFCLIDLLERQLKTKGLLPVHRLDKETSGIQVLAKSSTAASHLASEFQNRNTKKVYQGILRGVIDATQGEWNFSISDKSEGRKNPAGVAKDRVASSTVYRVIQSNKYFTYCEFEIKTGRQHQIRKHAVLAKHAILGDSRYGDPKYNSKMAEMYHTKRMFLHSYQLTLKDQVFTAPLGSDFQRVVLKIREQT